MDLIERYIADVSRRLPKRMRSDVAAELRSSLGEAYDATVGDFNRDSGRVASNEECETLASDLVKKFGPPAALAASYRPGPQWLIGPDLYPAFLRTLKVVALIIVALFAVTIVASSLDEENPLVEILKSIATSNLTGDLVSAMGWVVLVFWIIQLVTWHSKGEATAAAGGLDVFAPSHYCGPDADSWDPRELPKVDDPDRVSRTGLMVEIIIMVGLILLFAVFPHAMGASVSVNGERGWVALGGPGFMENRGLFYVGFVIVVFLNLVLLRHNRWTIPTRVVDIASHAIFTFALLPLVMGGEIIAVQAQDLVANGWTPEAAENLSTSVFPVMDTILRGILGGIIVGIVLSGISKTVKMAKRMG
jgi:hypothetical protein